MYQFKYLLALAATVALLTVTSPLATADDKPATTFSWQDDPQAGTTDLKYSDQPVVRYMYAYDTSSEERAHETFKVFHHVFGPGSEDIITKGPHGKFTHHRGIFFGFNKTQFDGQELDFWHCKQGEHQRHIRFQELAASDQQARMIAEIHWIDRAGQPVIIEARDFTFRPLSGDLAGKGFQIDFESTLTSKRGEITLTGDRQHAGFQIRAAQAIAENDGARYVRPAGFPEQAEAFQANDKTEPDKHIDLGWFAMTYELNGRRYTFEYFEDPSLPKPSRYSERPYGRFGAFFTAKVTEDQPLQVRYRVNVITGDTPSRDEIQQRYDQFVADVAKEK